MRLRRIPWSGCLERRKNHESVKVKNASGMKPARTTILKQSID